MTASDKKYLYTIGKNIARLRREKGLSQIDVCAEINMEKPNLSSIENGRQNVTALTLRKIAEVIGVEVKEFFEIK